MNNKAYFNMSYGVYVIGVMDGERPAGCVANSAMQVTAEPATFAVSINRENYTNGLLSKAGVFALNVVPENMDARTIGTFGFQSGRNVDKFSGVPYRIMGGAPVMEESCGHFICRVIDKFETYTHTIFLGEVLDCDVMNAAAPMTYSYYHKVIKGRAPKTAPTYMEKEDSLNGAGTKYVCSVCKYRYDGAVPFEALPEDYVCPVCGRLKSAFKAEDNGISPLH